MMSFWSRLQEGTEQATEGVDSHLLPLKELFFSVQQAKHHESCIPPQQPLRGRDRQQALHAHDSSHDRRLATSPERRRRFLVVNVAALNHFFSEIGQDVSTRERETGSEAFGR